MKRELLLIVLLMSAIVNSRPARADDHVINDQNGNEFMEEEAPKVKAPSPGRKLVPRIIDNSCGRTVMQEVVPDNDPLTRPYHAPDGYGNVGISTDKSGNIVPLIQHGAPPVMELGGQLQAFNEYAPVSVPMNVPGQLIPSYASPLGYPYRPYVSPHGYPFAYGQPNALNFHLGGLNIGIGSGYPAYPGPIAIPAPITAPFGYGTTFGAPAGSIFNGLNTGLPSSGSYSNNSVFGANVMQSRGSWRSF